MVVHSGESFADLVLMVENYYKYLLCWFLAYDLVCLKVLIPQLPSTCC